MNMSHPGRVLWLNGPFGVGKTTTSRVLAENIPGAHLFDPEIVGYMLGQFMADETVDDFQKWPMWRRLVAVVLAELSEYSRTPVIVPMTVLDQTIAREIFDELARRAVDVTHVLLEVDDAVLDERIHLSDEHPGRPAASAETRSWRSAKVDDCRAARPWLHRSAHVIDTTGRSPESVARAVLDI